MRKKILEIVKSYEDAALEWRASDGGLTMAACDILTDCNVIRKKLSLPRPEFITWFKNWVGGYNGLFEVSELCSDIWYAIH